MFDTNCSQIALDREIFQVQETINTLQDKELQAFRFYKEEVTENNFRRWQSVVNQVKNEQNYLAHLKSSGLNSFSF